jgi:hypothetical protein
LNDAFRELGSRRFRRDRPGCHVRESKTCLKRRAHHRGAAGALTIIEVRASVVK